MMDLKNTDFFKEITCAEAGVKSRRAISVAKSIINAFEFNIRAQVNEIEMLLLEQDKTNDLGPDSTTSLLIADDLAPRDFVEKSISNKHELRKLEWKLTDSVQAYQDRFGEEFLKSRNFLTLDEINDFMEGNLEVTRSSSSDSEGKAPNS